MFCARQRALGVKSEHGDEVRSLPLCFSQGSFGCDRAQSGWLKQGDLL